MEKGFIKISEVRDFEWINFKKYIDFSKYGNKHMMGVHFSNLYIFATDGKRLLRQTLNMKYIIKSEDVFTIPYFICQDLPKNFNIYRKNEYFKIIDINGNIKEFKLAKDKPVQMIYNKLGEEYFYTWYDYPDVSKIVPEDEIFEVRTDKTTIKVKVSKLKKILKDFKGKYIRLSTVKGKYNIGYLKIETYLSENEDEFKSEVTDIYSNDLNSICFDRKYLYDLLVRPFKSTDIVEIDIYDKDEEYDTPLKISNCKFDALLMPLRKQQ